MTTLYTNEFTWIKKDRTFVAEASDLYGRGDWTEGFDIKSHKTGVVNRFKPTGEERDREGELVANNFYNAVTSITVKIFND